MSKTISRALSKETVEKARIKTGISHKLYGPLARHDAVIMRRWSEQGTDITEARPLYIHLTVTGRCNARCKGCINMLVSPGAQGEALRGGSTFDMNPERDARAIVSLAGNHPDNEVIICFYGGEPLIAVDKMEHFHSLTQHSTIRDRVRYLLYTNGELIARSIRQYPSLMKEIWLYAVAVDGRKKQHNFIRSGTDLTRIHRNLRKLHSERQGDVLMWSTLREEQSLWDCYREFTYLKDKHLVNHFFWHWVETDSPFADFHAYAANYERDLRLIMEDYVSALQKGIILPIAHVNELILFLLLGKERGSSACGVELSKNYDILGGRIYACADLPPELALGEIDDDGTPHVRECSLSSLVQYKTTIGCYDCGVHAYCGGRCPVQALTCKAGRLLQYCQLMRLHVGIVQDCMPMIAEITASGNITPQNIYDRSAVIAQFTDVTP